MSESNPELAAPLAGTWLQCPFCNFLNLVREDEPLCVNCGLDMLRLLAAEAKPASAAVPAAGEHLAPVAPPARGGRKKGRAKPKRVKRTPGDLAAATRAPAPDAHSSLAPNVAPPVGLSLPPVSPVGVGVVAPPPAMFEPVGGTLVDESLEATVFASVASEASAPLAPRWTLEFADGTSVVLPGDNVVIGRQPSATHHATPLPIPDPTRTLSRTHALLRRDATSDTWTIQDLGSANGIATVSVTGDTTAVASGVAVAATEYLLVGTLQARLTRLTVAAGA